MKKTITISPFSRMEGDLELKVEQENGKIINAYSSGIMFRGFERILKGRDPMDSLVFTCRICGICGLAHSAASSKVLKEAYKAEMPPNAYYVKNILLAIEIIANHLTQFYMFFMVDLLNKKYKSEPYYDNIVKRFTPFAGESQKKVIQVRKKILEIMGIMGGKWPNSLVMQPGGVTKTLNFDEIVSCIGIIEEIREFFEKTFLGSPIENWLENKSLVDIEKWMDDQKNAESDLGIFIKFGSKIDVSRMGAVAKKLLSCGAYEEPDGTFWLKEGLYDNGSWLPFEQTKIEEHIAYSWYEGYHGGIHPSKGITEPNKKKENAYSWSKSPRYDNDVIEVGPLARMVMDHDPLASDVFKKIGSSVFTRQLMRIHETIRLVDKIKYWLDKIDPESPFYIKHHKAKQCSGVGLVEAARGMLGHWVSVKDGRIVNYQIITPTTWNFSPRDSAGNPGALEKSLIGLQIDDSENPVEIHHVIRSFDPCMACTVHAVRGSNSDLRFRVLS